MNNTLLKKDTILIDNFIEEKISEFENDIKNNKITWHTIEEMNQVIDGVLSNYVDNNNIYVARLVYSRRDINNIII